MQKQPVTISIIPSRLALGCSLGLAATTSLVLLFYAPPWLMVVVSLVLAAVIWYDWRSKSRWWLRWVPGREGGWQYRAGVGEAWHSINVQCDYLGAWLIGLRVSDRYHWLWPDSASPQERRVLCRVLLWSATDTHP